MPHTRRPYPSDLSDEEWALLEPLLTSHERRGRPPKWPAPDRGCRLLLAALGMRLADAPAGVPYSRQTVYYHFRRWRLDGRLRRAHDALRAEVRTREGRARNPSAAAIDSQAIKTSRANARRAGVLYAVRPLCFP
jgi:putative transposase